MSRLGRRPAYHCRAGMAGGAGQRVVLLSCGRLMYFGKRREMLPYFAFIEYPCPAYKNPSDYYRKYLCGEL